MRKMILLLILGSCFFLVRGSPSYIKIKDLNKRTIPEFLNKNVISVGPFTEHRIINYSVAEVSQNDDFYNLPRQIDANNYVITLSIGRLTKEVVAERKVPFCDSRIFAVAIKNDDPRDSIRGTSVKTAQNSVFIKQNFRNINPTLQGGSDIKKKYL